MSIEAGVQVIMLQGTINIVCVCKFESISLLFEEYFLRENHFLYVIKIVSNQSQSTKTYNLRGGIGEGGFVSGWVVSGGYRLD